MINESNYYQVNNKGLSQSKIKAYELDPNYMYRLHISGELAKDDKEYFKIGREVDSILTEMDKFQNTIISKYDDFRTKEAREWKAEQEALGKTVVKESEYEKIMAIAIAVQSTELWHDIEKNFTMQEIIQIPDNSLGEHFDCLYGKLDAYRIDKDGVCDLLDLKTNQTADRREFFYKALKLGYFVQLKFYSNLLQAKYPEITGFRYWFVVAEKSEPYRVQLFSVDTKLVDKCETNLTDTILEISNRKDWNRPNLTWKDAIKLTDPNLNNWEED